MFCTNCGNEISKNQRFCTNCGAKISSNKKISFNNVIKNIGIQTFKYFRHHKIVGFSILGIIISISVLFCIFMSYYYRHLALKEMYIDENIKVFIDEDGKEHLRLNAADYSNSNDSNSGWFGVFNEGRIFRFETIPDGYSFFTENKKDYCASLGKLQLINHKGKVIKIFNQNIVSLDRTDVPYSDDDYYIYPSTPEFYKGYTRIAYTDKNKIHKLSEIRTAYIDRNGNFVKRVPKDVDQAFKQGLRKTKRNIFIKELSCEDGTKGTCVAFVDKDGNKLTKAIYSTSKRDYFAVYSYPYNYQDVTLAYLNKGLKPTYVDKKGNTIYNDSFEYGTDFEHLLARVSPQQDSCDDYADYYPSFMINKKGKRVWSDMQPKYIYDIKHKKWIDYNENILGNKYLFDCIYLRLYQSRCWDEGEYEDQVIDQDFKLMYGEENMKSLIGDKAPNFNINDLILNNNRLIYKERYSNKLYELVYNSQTKKVELKEFCKN